MWLGGQRGGRFAPDLSSHMGVFPKLRSSLPVQLVAAGADKAPTQPFYGLSPGARTRDGAGTDDSRGSEVAPQAAEIGTVFFGRPSLSKRRI